MSLSENIRNIRREKNLTQERLAEALGVSTASVSKWETGQASPELSMLAELADFFEMSVDALMGHTLNSDRMEGLISQMEGLDQAGNYEEALQVGEKLLRNYPNNYHVVEKVMETYHNAHLFAGGSEENRKYMDRAIELTQRLFALLDKPDGAKKFELLSRMANHYEMLKEWDTARKYYEEGNVGHVNARALARCLANKQQDEEAAKAISQVFSLGLMELLTDVMMLGEVWCKMGKPERAVAALRWGCTALQAAGSGLTGSSSMLMHLLQLNLAAAEEKRGDFERAEACFQEAMRISREGCDSQQPDFTLSATPIVRSSGNIGPALAVRMFEGMELHRLAELARRQVEQDAE